MLDLSSGPGQLPFFALAGRYYISEAPLSLSYFAFHFLFFHCLNAISLTDCAVLAPSSLLGLLCLSTLSIFFPTHLLFFFFCQGQQLFFWLFFMSFLPSWSFLLSPPLWYLTPLYVLCFFPRPRGVKLCAQTPVSE